MREIFRKAKASSPSIIFFVSVCSMATIFLSDDILFDLLCRMKLTPLRHLVRQMVTIPLTKES